MRNCLLSCSHVGWRKSPNHSTSGARWTDFRLRTSDAQTAPYCLLLRPESPCRRGPLDLPIETLRIKWQDWIAPGGRIMVHRECRQWQHNVALSGRIPMQPAELPQSSCRCEISSALVLKHSSILSVSKLTNRRPSFLCCSAQKFLPRG